MIGKEDDLQVLHEFIARYRHKAIVLREIHSDLAQSCRRGDNVFTLTTLVLISLATFIGFSGTDNLQEVLKTVLNSSNGEPSLVSKLLVSNSKFVTVVFNFFCFSSISCFIAEFDIQMEGKPYPSFSRCS